MRRQTVPMKEEDTQPMEDEGGDIACWAHLFEDAQSADLIAIANSTAVRGLAWQSVDSVLHATLLVFDDGQEIEPHAENTADLLIVGMTGAGMLIIEEKPYPLWPGRVVLVPRGSKHTLHAESDRFACLTCATVSR